MKVSSFAELSQWNRAISACARQSQWMLSLQIFSKLQHTHIRSDVITLTSAINACDKGKSWQLAIHSFFWWRDLVVPNAITCTTLMSALNTNAEWQQCLCLFHFCLAERLQADAILFSAAINACAEGSQWQEAFRILNSMKPWRLAFCEAKTFMTFYEFSRCVDESDQEFLFILCFRWL